MLQSNGIINYFLNVTENWALASDLLMVAQLISNAAGPGGA